MRRGAGYWHGRERAVGMVLSRAKASTDTLSVAMVAAPLGRRFSYWGIIVSHHVPAVRGSHGENLVLMWTCGDGTIGVAPSLEAPNLETRLGLWQCWWLVGGVVRA